MKYGVNTLVWTARVGAAEEPLFHRIREWGFDGAELFISADEPSDIPRVRKMLDEAQLERTTCGVLPRDAHLVSSDPTVRAHAVRFLTRCIEPLNRFETYFLNTAADAARLVKEVGSPQVRILFDTFHANIEEQNPARALRSIASWLGHVHISENDRGIPG